ncbi:MAG: GAF domain-containing sensor histidine kinase [Novosphingobium sp.]|nr:GAF domain-containing sensor histidine kinase [Burkholderiales bacterium]MCZ8322258.1 GAF domain-containing sensor histidine kinase [Novosphingobium sp.]
MLDHRSAKSWPEAHSFKIAMRWELELNVPIIVGGEAQAALLIFRDGEHPFSDAEIALAESLGQQLAVAMQAVRLAAREREAAAALARAESMDRVSMALRLSVERLGSAGGPQQVVVESLRAVAQALAPMPVVAMSWAEVDVAAGTASMRMQMLNGERQDLRGPAPDHGWPLSDPVLGAGWERLLRDGHFWCRNTEQGAMLPDGDRLHESHGARSAMYIALHRQQGPFGWLTFHLAGDEAPTSRQCAVMAALSRQVSLAIEMSRLAEDARQATLSQERNRVAGEIHDSLAQNFAGVALQLEAAQDALKHCEMGPVASSIERARNLARFGLAEARRSVMTLRPIATLAQGLEPALRALCARSQVDGLLRCSFQVDGHPALMDGESELALFRIAQESVSNAVRHAQARRIDVRLARQNNETRLVMEDDGCGLPSTAAARGGQGLLAMRERAERVGAELRLNPSASGGTCVEVVLRRRTGA